MFQAPFTLGSIIGPYIPTYSKRLQSSPGSFALTFWRNQLSHGVSSYGADIFIIRYQPENCVCSQRPTGGLSWAGLHDLDARWNRCRVPPFTKKSAQKPVLQRQVARLVFINSCQDA